MNRKEMRDLFVGPIGTVPTPFDKSFEVDYGRMYELTQWWVANGVVNLKSCGDFVHLAPGTVLSGGVKCRE